MRLPGLEPASSAEELRLRSAIRMARAMLRAQQPALGDAELEQKAEAVGRSNYLAGAISEAIRRNDFTNAELLLKQFPGTINELRSFGQPLLSTAAMAPTDEALDFLLAHKADPNQAMPDRQPVLFKVIQFRQWTRALKLLDAGASANATNVWGQSPLGLMVQQNAWFGGFAGAEQARQVLLGLLEHGANPFAPEHPFGPVRLGEAASVFEQTLTRPNRDISDLFLTNKPDVSRRNAAGETALHLAAMHGRTNALSFLLDTGFLVDQTNSCGLTALQLVAGSLDEESDLTLGKVGGLWVCHSSPVSAMPPGLNIRRRVLRPGFWPGGALADASRGEVIAQLLNRGAMLDVFCAAALGLTNELADLLRSQPASVNGRDAAGRVPLHYAVGAGQRAAARLLLQRGSEVSVATTLPLPATAQGFVLPAGTTPLLLAARAGNDPLVQLLLQARAQIAAADEEGNTALHWSARRLQTNCLALLLASHAPLETTNRAGHTPLRWAVEAGLAPNARLILDAGARLDTGVKGETLMHLAAQAGSADVLKLLRRRGLALEARDSEGRTPFLRALINPFWHWDALNWFLAEGANIHARDLRGDGALHEAVVQMNESMIHVSEGSWFEVWKRNWLGQPGLRQQTVSKLLKWKLITIPTGPTVTNISLTRWLLDHGAKAGQTNLQGQTPLHVLCGQWWLNNSLPEATNRLALLLAGGAKVQAGDARGATCLHVAATNAPPEIISLLARQVPAGQSLRDGDGRSPLHYATRYRPENHEGAAARVAALVAGGFDPNATDGQGRTPLHEALSSHLEFPWGPEDAVVLTLLTNRANPNLQDRQGLTPLHLAMMAWRDGCDSSAVWKAVSLLLTNGAEPNVRDHQGRTPLHLLAGASNTGWAVNPDADHVLLSGNWDPTVRDKGGQAPIHLLASNLPPYAVPMPGTQRLLTNSLAVNLTNGTGDTPLHLAIKADRYNVAGILMQGGANPALRNASGDSAWRMAAALEPSSMMALTVKPPGASFSFFSAISAGDRASFDRWLAADATICSVTNVNGQTPLIVAKEHSRHEMAKRLIDLGAR